MIPGMMKRMNPTFGAGNFNSGLDLPRLVDSTDLGGNSGRPQDPRPAHQFAGESDALPTFSGSSFATIPSPRRSC